MVQSLTMLSRRLELHSILEDILGSGNVYFQPPSNIRMQYPAIVYKRHVLNEQYANNRVYGKKVRYQITVIDRDPDSGILDRIIELPLCTFTQHFVSDSLNHDVYNIYF